MSINTLAETKMKTVMNPNENELKMTNQTFTETKWKNETNKKQND